MTERLSSCPGTTFGRHSDIDVGNEILFVETNRGRRIAAVDRRLRISLDTS